MKRKIYCDYLRLLCAFSVVVGHVSGRYWGSVGVSGPLWHTLNFYDSIIRWCIPAFLMITGVLLIPRDITIKKLYSRYILKIVIVFLFWSLFYAATNHIQQGIIDSIKTNLYILATGDFHMWYVLMLFGIYICYPIIKRIAGDEKVMKYYLIISFVFAILAPWMVQSFKDFLVYRFDFVEKLIWAIETDLHRIDIKMVLGYPFYVVFGYYLDKIEMKKKTRMIIYLLSIVGFALTIIQTHMVAQILHYPVENYYGAFSIGVFLEALGVFTLFKYHVFKNEKMNRFVLRLSDYNLGAYLVHVFVFNCLFGYVNTLSFNPILSVPILSLIILVISFGISAILNQIPIIKKYCV